MTFAEVKATASAVVAQLVKWAPLGRPEAWDRGRLANLRRGLKDATRQYAWPVLAELDRKNALGNQRELYETVAGCFALHPNHFEAAGNFGATLRGIQQKTQGSKEDWLDLRFRRLVACDREGILKHLRYAVQFAKSKDAPINYQTLFMDLWLWGEKTKVNWARAYWTVPEPLIVLGDWDAEGVAPGEQAET